MGGNYDDDEYIEFTFPELQEDDTRLPRYDRRRVDANGFDIQTGERRKRDIMEDIMANRLDIEVVKQNVSSIKHNDLKHVKSDIDHMHQKIDKVDSKIEKVDGRMWVLIVGVVTSIIVPIILAKVGIK